MLYSPFSGKGWAMIGDAAGFVDAITGEGLYYAVRSGDLASQVVLSEMEPERKAESYRQLIARDFGLDLTYGAGLAKNVESAAKQVGLTVEGNDGTDKNSPNYRSLAAKIKAAEKRYRPVSRGRGTVAGNGTEDKEWRMR